jgi:2-methylisocitrate lyase-like PEP mutase family enzyme
MTFQPAAVQELRALHHRDEVLLLANVWDAMGARIVASHGAKAIATTSAGLAWACGYADGSKLPSERLMIAVEDIVRCSEVPVTADIEDGYSADPAAVVNLAVALARAGVAGVNIEDRASPPETLAAKLAAVRSALDGQGLDLFLNARTDVYLRRIAEGQPAIEETLRRAERYKAAGADGLFVPGLADAEAMRAISGASHGLPLNVMAVPQLPELNVLRRAGVRRLSLGAATAMKVYGLFRELSAEFLKTGNVAGVVGDTGRADALAYADANALFTKQA